MKTRNEIKECGEDAVIINIVRIMCYVVVITATIQSKYK